MLNRSSLRGQGRHAQDISDKACTLCCCTSRVLLKHCRSSFVRVSALQVYLAAMLGSVATSHDRAVGGRLAGSRACLQHIASHARVCLASSAEQVTRPLDLLIQ